MGCRRTARSERCPRERCLPVALCTAESVEQGFADSGSRATARVGRARAARVGALASGQRFLAASTGALRLPLRPGGDQRGQRAIDRGCEPGAAGSAQPPLARLDRDPASGMRVGRGFPSPQARAVRAPTRPRVERARVPASQPAHRSATQASPGTYQVQSTSEWIPNTTTRQSMLSMPTRSGV